VTVVATLVVVAILVVVATLVEDSVEAVMEAVAFRC